MKSFLCEIEVDNKKQTTMIRAESVEAARNLLINKGWIVLNITPLVTL